MRGFVRIAIVTAFSLTIFSGCETLFPDKLFYPVNTKKSEASGETTGKTAVNASREPQEKESAYGHNALTRVFPEKFDDAWDDLLDAMLSLPLTSVDKSSGILITGWIRDEGASGNQTASTSLFGGRLVRYRYVVRLEDVGGASEVTVIPFAQVSENRRWRDAKPTVIISGRLMKKLIAKMEE